MDQGLFCHHAVSSDKQQQKKKASSHTPAALSRFSLIMRPLVSVSWDRWSCFSCSRWFRYKVHTVIHYVVGNKSPCSRGFSPHDYVCEVQLYSSWTSARPNWITSPNVPSSVLLSLSWRHNVITLWCPLFSALLSWCCVHEFINGTLWLVIHRRAAEAELQRCDSLMMRSGSRWTWAESKASL